MQRITIHHSSFDFDRDDVTDEVVAAFVVGEGGIERIECGQEFVPTSVTVVSPEDGKVVSLKSDPLRWAELLPGAYRTGDYFVEVEAYISGATVAGLVKESREAAVVARQGSDSYSELHEALEAAQAAFREPVGREESSLEPEEEGLPSDLQPVADRPSRRQQ